MIRFASRTAAVLFLMIVISGSVHAQATRTWVSGEGDDVNPCSRTAPCKTFAGAISKTQAGGEISVLDPGGYGAVTITKAMTINGDGSLGSILSTGTNGIIVNAGASDVVILRNLSINGARMGTNGVRFINGSTLIVEDCTLYGFTGNAIDVDLTNSGSLIVNNSTITAAAKGVRVNSTSGGVAASLNHVSISRTGTAVEGMYGATDVYNSVITQNTNFGILAQGSGIVSIENSVLTSNGVAAQANTGALVRLSNNDIHDNLSGLGCGGGTIASANNNRKAGNVGGTVPVCAPTVMITLQ